MQLTILAYAATTDIKLIELVVCDLDRSPESRQLLEDFTASTYFRRVAAVDTQDGLDVFLANGTAKVAMTIPAGFCAERAAGRTGRVQVVTDGSDAMVGTLGLAYAQGVLQAAAERTARAHLWICALSSSTTPISSAATSWSPACSP